jgi:hypothetical protein
VGEKEKVPGRGLFLSFQKLRSAYLFLEAFFAAFFLDPPFLAADFFFGAAFLAAFFAVAIVFLNLNG